MNLDDYLARHGFASDPLASTNAEAEELLKDYFIPPPYFVSVLGQPTSPESHIVFAPRGGGKTAQRRIIELESESGNFLCILHDSFPVNGRQAIQAVDLDFHLREVARKVLLGILLHLDVAPDDAKNLDKSVRRMLVTESELQLGPLTAEEFRREVQSLKSYGRRTSEWLQEHSGPIKPIINAIFKKAELDPPAFDASGAETVPSQMVESWGYRLGLLVQAAKALGFESIYVLVDKVDELTETSADPGLAFDLIRPLVTNLPAMEMDGLRFKVFLWDRVQPSYIEAGGRPDRIRDFTLGWDAATLADMMTRRLKAHSDGRVESLDDLIAEECPLSLHKLCAELAVGSPRDMVRLAAQIRAAHLNRDDPDARISVDDIWKGINTFSRDIANERFRKFMPDILKVNSFRFTQSRLANDLLRIKKQSAQAKVAEWRKTGLVEKITELQDSRNRPQHLYGVVDARLAIAMREDMTAEDILSFFLHECPSCHTFNISDESEIVCIKCQTSFDGTLSKSLLDDCQRT